MYLGVVLIDSLENPKGMNDLISDWNKHSNSSEPHTFRVHGLIYSHFHADHTFGSTPFIHNKDIQIWAHELTALYVKRVSILR